jgi:chromate transporter
MTENQFWIGLPLAFLTPGSIVNVGIYFGSIIDGIRGALLSAFFLYLPCFLSIYGILPSWRYYRDKPGVQRLIIGITCVANGFVLSTVQI